MKQTGQTEKMDQIEKMEIDEVLEFSPGVRRIASERLRQVVFEGFTADHDDRLVAGELVCAAVCYATNDGVRTLDGNDPWPWPARPEDRRPSKKGDRIRQLEIAGAMIAAEIDRLLRKVKI